MNSEGIRGEANEPEGSVRMDEPTTRKRGGEDVEGAPRTRVKLGSPERTSGSDTESIESCQDEEVANATKDMLSSETESIESCQDEGVTNDTLSPPVIGPTTEYEVADTEQEIPSFICLDESSEEGFQNCNVHLRGISKSCNVQSIHFDIATFADSSEEVSTSPTSNSDVDPGLPRNDYLDFENCLLCKMKNKDSDYPFCRNCYGWRKNLFPAPPKKRKKSYSTIGEQEPAIEISSTSELPSSENGNISEEQNSILSDTVIDNENDGCGQPSTSSSVGGAGLCQICFSRVESGLFVHSNSAHLYGCYNCAEAVWYRTNGCPICRRKVYKVTKLYI